MTAAGAATGPRVPERQCVACRRSVPRTGLIRLVRSPDGTVALAGVRHAPGRGAYVCRNATCVGQAIQRNGFQRALKRKVDNALLDTLKRLVAPPTPGEPLPQ